MLMPILLALSATPQAPVETLDDTPSLKRGPSLQFITDTIDLGPISDEQEVEWEFPFKNTGGEDLVFDSPVRALYGGGYFELGPFEADLTVAIGPRLEVEYDVVDLGPICDEEPVEWIIYFTNVGDEDLEMISGAPWPFADPVPGAAHINDGTPKIGPRFTIYSDTIDLGVISDDREVPWEFHFTNTGD